MVEKRLEYNTSIRMKNDVWDTKKEGDDCPECGAKGLTFIVELGSWLVCPQNPYEHFRAATDQEKEVLAEKQRENNSPSKETFRDHR